MDYGKLARETLGRSGLPLQTVIAQALKRAGLESQVWMLDEVVKLADLHRDDYVWELLDLFRVEAKKIRKRLEELPK